MLHLGGACLCISSMTGVWHWVFAFCGQPKFFLGLSFLFSFRAISGQGVCAAQTQVRQRSNRLVHDHAWVVENLLKLNTRLVAYR